MTAVPLALGSTGADAAFLLARILFGAVVAFNGLNHFLNSEQMTGYAGMKGVPAPSLAVPVTGGMLLFGGVGIALGVVPAVAAGAVALFLLVTTPVMHDFWAVPEDQRQNELINFQKNVAMLGAAVVFLALAGTDWAYALGVGL